MSLPLFVSAQLEVLGPLEGVLRPPLALAALQPQHDLLRGLGLLPQNGLGLTSESLLLPVVSPTALSGLRLGRLLVLSHLELLVGPASGAVRPARLGNVHLKDEMSIN